MLNLKKIAEYDWQKGIFKYLVLALFAAYATLYVQQNNVIEAQERKIDKICTDTEKGLGEKVDNRVLMEMIKGITAQQAVDTKLWVDQKKTNDKVLENLQKLNINVTLLNERLEAK
jgi:hypothetical protein